jgi:GNAT superfamily N-acetyltransferase
MHIRPVSRDDYEQWLPLWLGYNAFYLRTGVTALDPQVTATTWSRLFDPQEPLFGLVAQDDGSLVGLAHYLLYRVTAAIEPKCYLNDLFTAEAARGKGVGKALIYGVRDKAAEAGCTSIYWHTHETNAVARRLYDAVANRTGFIVYGMSVNNEAF